MHFLLTPLLFIGLCLIPCSWSHALQNTPIVVSEILPAPAGDAELYYNPMTGELIVTTNGVAAVAITAQSDNAYDLSTVDADGNGSFDVPGFGPVSVFSGEGFVDNQLVAFGANTGNGLLLPTGVHNLGAILLPGAFTPTQFEVAFGDFRLDRIVSGQPLIQLSGVVRIIDAPPVEIDVAVNGGDVQRSMLREIAVTFPSDVQIDAGAFSLVNRDDNSIVPTVSFAEVPGSDPTVATLTFSGAGINLSGSLPDGNYEFAINGDLITNAQGIALDADGDGTPGGLLVFGDDVNDKLYRFFGDIDGSRVVDTNDLGPFLATFFETEGSSDYNENFDFEGNGAVDTNDLGPYLANFFKILEF